MYVYVCIKVCERIREKKIKKKKKSRRVQEIEIKIEEKYVHVHVHVKKKKKKKDTGKLPSYTLGTTHFFTSELTHDVIVLFPDNTSPCNS